MNQISSSNSTTPYGLDLRGIELMISVYNALRSKILSNSILYDFESIMDYRNSSIYKYLAARIIERNTQNGEKNMVNQLLSSVNDLVGTPPCGGSICQGKEWLFEVIKAVRFMR